MTKQRASQSKRMLLPWFLDFPTIRKIEALLPYYYHSRFRFYFDRYGCLRCSRKNVVYWANGFCKPCHGLIINRLQRTDKSMKRRYDKPELPSAEFLRKMTSAQELLKEFRD
jgi:hypothetical protein